MPIINGTYQSDTLLPAKQAQEQVFGPGEYTRKDMSDYSSAAYNYLMKQQEQAYNLELWNLNNHYNDPSSQMKRFQDAGLNPYLIYNQQNTANTPQSASAPSFRSAGTYAKQQQNAINAIGQIMNTVKAARETYDYMKYGREINSWERNLVMQKSQGQALENYWNEYLLGMRGGPDDPISIGPRARMYSYQLDTQQQRFQQLLAVVGSIQDQRARTRALEALDKYRLQILQGQYGAIMSINTGTPGLDSFLRMLGFYLLGK